MSHFFYTAGPPSLGNFAKKVRCAIAKNKMNYENVRQSLINTWRPENNGSIEGSELVPGSVARSSFTEHAGSRRRPAEGENGSFCSSQKVDGRKDLPILKFTFPTESENTKQTFLKTSIDYHISQGCCPTCTLTTSLNRSHKNVGVQHVWPYLYAPPGGGGIGVRPSYDMSSQCKHTISLPPIHLPASSTLLSRCLFCSVL